MAKIYKAPILQPDNPVKLTYIMQAHNPKTFLPCPIPNCGKTFRTAGNLNEHVKRHNLNGDPPLPCPICKQKYSKQDLPWHVRRHTLEKKFKCNQCEWSFITRQNLTKHKETHKAKSERNVFACRLCSKKFLYKGYLKNHMNREHTTNKKTVDCTFCDKKFVNNYTLTIHLRIHTGETPFPCSLCDKVFMSRPSRNFHLTYSHLPISERKFECSHCGAKCISQSKLNRHQLVHQKRARGHHPCLACGKVLNTEKTLEQHMTTHTRESKYKCKICNKCLTTRGNLTEHLKIHSDSKPLIYVCIKCDKAYPSKASLKYHMYSHSEEKYRCDECLKQFNAPQNLRKHIQIKHTVRQPRFHCEYCEKSFCDRVVYNEHIKRHIGEKAFGCRLCPQRYVSGSELTRHISSKHRTGEKTDTTLGEWNCPFCLKSFKRSFTLSLHIRSHTREIYRKCKSCSQIFYSVPDWKNHTCKPDREPGESLNAPRSNYSFKCVRCPKTFYNSKFLSDHMNRKHGQQYQFNCRPCIVLIQKLQE